MGEGVVGLGWCVMMRAAEGDRAGSRDEGCQYVCVSQYPFCARVCVCMRPEGGE
jgi:hypothetical protein